MKIFAEFHVGKDANTVASKLRRMGYEAAVLDTKWVEIDEYGTHIIHNQNIEVSLFGDFVTSRKLILDAVRSIAPHAHLIDVGVEEER